MSNDTTMHETTATDAAVDTGAAIATAGAFGLFGAIVGKAIGSLGTTKARNLSGKIGMWLGGLSFATLSLYASFKSHVQHERTITGLRQENQRLREELNGAPAAEPKEQELVPMMPLGAVSIVAHHGMAQEATPEKAL